MNETGWAVCTLGDLCTGAGRYGCTEAASPYDPELPRYVRITDLDDRGSLRRDSLASLPWAKALPHRLAPHDLLFARSGNTVGKTYLYDRSDGECAHAGYLIRYALDPARCVPAYVAQYTRSPMYWEWIARTARQAAQSNINAIEFAALEIPLPPLSEQQRIVAVLDNCDRLITFSEQLCGRLRGLKRALLCELLRPGGPGRASASDRARLPAGWQLASVAELLAGSGVAMRSGPFGSELKKKDLATDGIPLLGIDNVDVDAFIPRYKRFVSRETFFRLERYAVKPGDVMVTIMGTVGRSCVVPKDIGRALSSKHVFTLTFDPERYLGELACAQFNHAPWVREHFSRDGQGGIMTAIRSETLRTVRLPVPPMAEQRRILSVLQRCDARLVAEQHTLERHRLIKRGLMSDLFGGRHWVGR